MESYQDKIKRMDDLHRKETPSFGMKATNLNAEHLSKIVENTKQKRDWKFGIMMAILGAILALLGTWLIEYLKSHHIAGM